MRILSLFVILLFLLTERSFSQSSRIDSLKTLISSQNDDTTKVNTLLKLISALNNENFSDSYSYYLEAISVSEKIGFTKGIAKSNFNLSYYFLNKNQPDSAQNRARKALGSFQILKDEESVGDSYTLLADVKQRFNDYDSSFIYHDMAYALRESLGDEYGLAKTKFSKSVIYSSIGENILALKHCEDALKFFKANDKKREMWYAMNILGVVYDGMGLYDDALKYYLESLDIVLELDDQQGAVVLYNNIAIVYDYMSNYDQSLEYYKKAFAITRATNDRAGEALIYNNMAAMEAQLGDTLKSLESIRKAISINEELGMICDLSYNYEGIGDLYAGGNILDSAYYFLSKAIELGEECQDKALLASAYKNLGIVYKKRKENQKAIAYLKKSLNTAKASGLKHEVEQTSKELSKFYESIGDYEQALFYHKLFQESKDSIFNSETSDNIASMTLEYDFKKEKKLLELENEKRAIQMSSELAKEEQNRNTILIVLLLSIVLIGTLLRAYFLIRNRNKRLTKMNEEKNTLIGVVAHDLRSPLNNMKALIPIIRNSSSQNNYKDTEHFLSLFDKSTLRMSDMINRILDVNAIESQKISIKKEHCDIAEILDNTISSFDASVAKKGLRVFKNFQREKSHKAIVDRNYLTQVFENIISNAIKFSESNKSLYFGIKLEEGNVIISVKDEGPGINKEDLEHLFQKYQKLSARPTANETSTGLGLSNAKKYVEAMNGKIWCDSTPGKGTTFFISFKTIRNATPQHSSFFSF